MKVTTLYIQSMEKFLDGPEWFQLSSLERRPGQYRAPTLALFAWIAGFLWRSLSIPALLLLIPGGLVFLYSTISLDSPIRVTTIAILMVMVVELVIGYFFRPKFRIERTVPERLRAGANFTVEYRITNLRKRPAWDIELDAYMIKKGLDITQTARVTAISGRETVTVSARGTTSRRGVYHLFSPIADSLFPLAISKWSCSNRELKQTIHVYPAYHILNKLYLPTGHKFQRNGTSRVSKVGESADFYGCREFRDGDDPRHIYWRGSARTGQLIVKEFQNEYLSRIALVVDTHVPYKQNWFRLKPPSHYYPALEAALSMTASIVDYLTRGEYVVDIFAAGKEVYHFQAGRHLSCFDSILDILAEVKANPEPQLNLLSDTVMEEISSIGSAMVILLGWDDERAQLINRLRESGVSLKVIIIDPKPDVPDNLIRLNSTEINDGMVHDL